MTGDPPPAGPRCRRAALGPALLAGLLALTLPACDRAPGERAPGPAGANLILVVVDTLRADVLEPWGGAERTGPTLAALAKTGAVFADCRAPAPWTLPSMTSLFTGLYPRSHGSRLHGLERNLWRYSKAGDYGLASDVPSKGKQPRRLPAEVTTLADVFRERGYATYLRATNPCLEFGLDERFETSHVAISRGDEVVDWGLDALARRDPERPFLLVLHFIDPHVSPDGFAGMEQDLAALAEPDRTPLENAHRQWSRYEDDPRSFRAELEPRRRAYEVCTRYVDRQLGRFLARLGGLALGPTYLVFTSDHGEDFRDHWDVDRASSHTDPRRQWNDVLGIGHGHNLHQAVTHVPLLITGPGIPAGLRLEQTVSLVDVLPTLCELSGIVPPPDLQGRSLVTLLAGHPDSPRPCLSESLAYGREKVAFYAPDGWLLVLPGSRGERPQLFDRSTDPREAHDLAAREPERVAALTAQYQRFAADLRPPPPAAEATSTDGIDARELDAEQRRSLQGLGYVGDEDD